MKWDNDSWALNCQLLKDDTIKEEIVNQITIYKLNKTHVNIHEEWDKFKAKVKREAIYRSKAIKERERNEINERKEQIIAIRQELELDSLNRDKIKILSNLNKDFKILADNKREGNKIRAKVKYIKEFERPKK